MEFWLAGRGRSHRAVARTGVAIAVCAILVAFTVGQANAAQPLTKAAYDKQLSAIGKEFATDLNLALTQTGLVRRQSDVVHSAQRRLTTLQHQLGDIDKTLRAIPPPTSIRSRHARLVAAVRQVELELTPIIASLRKGDLKPLDSIGSLDGLKNVESAVKAIDAAGYAIGG